MSRPIIYLLSILIAEFAAVMLPSINRDFVTLGMVLCSLLLFAMIIDAARMYHYSQRKLVYRWHSFHLKGYSASCCPSPRFRRSGGIR
jgi:hypothetical protein